MARVRMLPDGTGTKSDKVYVQRWRDVSVGIERHLPGWQCQAFDPDVGYDTSYGVRVCVPVEVAMLVTNLSDAVLGIARAAEGGVGYAAAMGQAIRGLKAIEWTDASLRSSRTALEGMLAEDRVKVKKSKRKDVKHG